MYEYNVWADMLNKYHTSTDLVQAIWIISFTIITVTLMIGLKNTVKWIMDRFGKDKPKGKDMVHHPESYLLNIDEDPPKPKL